MELSPTNPRQSTLPSYTQNNNSRRYSYPLLHQLTDRKLFLIPTMPFPFCCLTGRQSATQWPKPLLRRSPPSEVLQVTRMRRWIMEASTTVCKSASRQPGSLVTRNRGMNAGQPHGSVGGPFLGPVTKKYKYFLDEVRNPDN